MNITKDRLEKISQNLMSYIVETIGDGDDATLALQLCCGLTTNEIDQLSGNFPDEPEEISWTIDKMSLTNSVGLAFCIGDLANRPRYSIADIENAVLEAVDVDDLYLGLSVVICDEIIKTEDFEAFTRFTIEDVCGNKKFLKIYKDN